MGIAYLLEVEAVGPGDPDCELCANAVDDDGDTYVDCADSDCDSWPTCIETSCADAVDNDQDGAIDCADPDCVASGLCEDCDNSDDDDGDTLADCEDPDCHQAGNGCPEVCDDGLDNDGDGATDCADTDCETECPETACADARDNDEDGATDCADSDCAELPACRDPEPEPPALNGPDCADTPTDLPESCDTTANGADVTVDPQRAGGALILLHSGQERLDATDLYLKGRDPVVDVRIKRRHLTGFNPSVSPFGGAWTFNYQQRLTALANGDLVHEALGRRDIFVKTGDYRWEGRLGRYEVITRAPGSGVATMRTRGGNELQFALTGSGTSLLGRLERVRSARGNVLEILFEPPVNQPDPSLRRIVGINDSYGRATTFQYEDPANPGLVTRIVDPDAREVKYAYDGGVRLASATSPAVTSTDGVNDFPAGRQHGFVYRAPTGNAPADAKLANAISSVIFPKETAAATGGAIGDPRLAWTYHEDGNVTSSLGRVATHAIGNANLPAERRAGGQLLYSYDPIPGTGTAIGTTTVLNRRATETAFDVDRRGHVLREVVSQPRRAAASVTSSYEYNVDGDLVGAQRPIGALSERLHEGVIGHPRPMHGNEVRRREVGDARGGDQASVESNVVYEPVFNKPFKVTSPADPADPPCAVCPAGKVTTYLLDYMENLPANTEFLADRLGLSVPELEDLFQQAGVTDLGVDVNGDGVRSQRWGNVIRVDYPDVSEPESQSAFETTRYNDLGQLVGTTDAEGNVTEYEYYPEAVPEGQVGTVAGVGGYLRLIRRDAVGGAGRDSGLNPTPVQQTIQFEYCARNDGAFPANKRGVPTAIIDPRGVKHVFLVNELDEVVTTIWAAELTEDADPALQPFSYEETLIRDANGNVIRREVAHRGALDGDQAPVVTTYEYDILDQLRKVTADLGGLNEVTTFAYDENGNLVERRRGVGTDEETLETWEWDDRDLPISSTVAIGPGVVATVLYDIDDNGNVTAITDADGCHVSTFEYDGLDRLRVVVDRVGTRETLEYDPSSNVIGRSWVGAPSHDVATPTLLAESRSTFDERSRP